MSTDIAKAPKAQSVKLEVRLATATLAGTATIVTATVQPFWPTQLLVALAIGSFALGLAYPRTALLLALSSALFPIGNATQGGAALYGALALVWFAVFWRDARAGMLFIAGPLLAPLALVGVLPLIAQRARGIVRRALVASSAVLCAGTAAALRGEDLPLTGTPVGDLGVGGSDDPIAVLLALRPLIDTQTPLLTTALVLGVSAALLPFALRRGPAVTAVLGVSQILLIIAWAPTIPWPGIVLSTLLAGGLLGLKPGLVALRRSRPIPAPARAE